MRTGATATTVPAVYMSSCVARSSICRHTSPTQVPRERAGSEARSLATRSPRAAITVCVTVPRSNVCARRSPNAASAGRHPARVRRLGLRRPATVSSNADQRRERRGRA
jgi:hypothetical protein